MMFPIGYLFLRPPDFEYSHTLLRTVNYRVPQVTGYTAITYKKRSRGRHSGMRLISVCAIVLAFALTPLGHALAGSAESPAAPGDSEEQDEGQTKGNEEPGCD